MDRAFLAGELLMAAKELVGSKADQVSEVQSALEELDDALSAAMDAARDVETKARAVGGEVSRVVGGQMSLYTWRMLKAFMDSEHQPGSVASLSAFLDRHMRELVETGDEVEASVKVAGPAVAAGDRVKYVRNFLRSIGEYGEMGLWTGTVKGVRPMGGLVLAEVAWDNGETMKVNARNLVLVSRLHLEPV